MAGLKDRGYDFTRTGPTVQMHVWYLQGRRRAVTGLGPFLGQSGATGAGGEEGAGACLGCRLPSTRHSPLVPGRGLLGQGWEGRDPLCHPPHAPLTPTQLSCLLPVPFQPLRPPLLHRQEDGGGVIPVPWQQGPQCGLLPGVSGASAPSQSGPRPARPATGCWGGGPSLQAAL